MRHKILLILLALISFSILAPGRVKAEEYKIKAVFLSKFAEFIEWPDTLDNAKFDGKFVIGIIGENPFNPGLETIYKDRSILNKKVKIRYFESISDIAYCHMLFISASMEPDLESLMNRLKGKPVLTVSDNEGFTEKGVMINFFEADKKLQFFVNVDSIYEHKLEVSHLLLDYAKIYSPSRGINEQD